MSKMTHFILKRLGLISIVLVIVSVITFSLTYITRGDPAVLWAGPRPTPEQIAQARKELGLDKPFYLRYFLYVSNLLRGDLGTSIRTRQSVTDDIKTFFPATFELATVSMIVSLIFGIPLGILSAVRRETLIDHVTRTFSITGVSIPLFWLGMMLQLVFYAKIKILPIQGRISSEILAHNPFTERTGLYFIDTLLAGNFAAFKSTVAHIILPAVAMSWAILAIITRISRSSLIEVMQEGYIRTSKAFGVKENLIKYKYGLKNAMIPTVTMVGMTYGWILGGTVLIESIFDWPGMGRYIWISLMYNDYPAILGCTLTYALIFLIINLIVDLVYAIIDPRIKITGQ
jgi:peptide/nickel transport system permease protein